MKNMYRIFFHVLLSTASAGLCALVVILLYTNALLPPVKVLEDIQLQVPLKVYTRDEKLIGEYGEKRRDPISIQAVPPLLKQAILATEDRRFYEHKGIDLRGLARASFHLLTSGSKGQGASTITMQVARNFFLSRKKTFGRKLNEILLAIKIEKELSKDKILELYLNKIYFGKRAYGVQAAAQVYYGTTIDKLDLPQIAMIAGLPQAPSIINPISHPQAALKRRTHVLKRMLHYGFINENAFAAALDAPIATRYHGRVVDIEAPYISEMARKELVDKFGPDVYTSGLNVYTTIDSRLQSLANYALQEGLLEYDKRHGYRGAVSHFPLPSQEKVPLEEWANKLKAFPKTTFTLPAAIIAVSSEGAHAVLANQQRVFLPFKSMLWAKPTQEEGLGPAPQNPAQVVTKGDVVYVEPDRREWRLSQLPKIEGALASLSPQDGKILALVGGFDFYLSHFNRATQSTRQPGSNFKPFIYAAAFEHGFTAATVINDAPVVYKEEGVEDAWRPKNDSRRFYGPTRLRVGLTKSRNLVSIRLLQTLGVSQALETISLFGFNKQALPRNLSLALGSSAASPLEMAVGYAVFANGGHKITSHVIQRITNEQGKVLYEAEPLIAASPEEVPAPRHAPQVISAQTAYIMTSILQDAIKTGTGHRANVLHRSDIAGKTGTTNSQIDTWYTGYSPSLVTSVWVGYDEPRSVEEYGAQAALPIWIKFTGPALQGVPETKPAQPYGLVSVKIDPNTGLLAAPGQSNAIFEIFDQDTVPQETAVAAGQERNAITPVESSAETLF